MVNGIIDSLKKVSNVTITENGATARKTTFNKVYDMFGLAGAYRHRTNDDCVLLFKNAFEENAELAVKCLFYMRDIRGGQGERRYFRICYNWLAKNYPEVAERNMKHIPEYGRWDDLYCLMATPLEEKMFELVSKQLALDITSYKESDTTGVSLLAKWLKSENCSSAESKKLAAATRKALKMTHKNYRKMLSRLRTRINIVEKLMSENRWEEIEFDKIPSKAGLIYRNAFAHNDIIGEKYTQFMADKTNTVNAGALYPYDIVYRARKGLSHWAFASDAAISSTEREALDKYWNNLPDYIKGSNKKLLCVVDTSGSMVKSDGVGPIDVAISLGMYCGERIQGEFHNHYISFASRPQLIEIEGVDLYDKVRRIYKTNLVDNTNLIAVFNLLKSLVKNGNATAADLPDTIVVISDMEIDRGSCWGSYSEVETEMERIEKEWTLDGLRLPNLVYWNVEARHNIFLSSNPSVSYVSGCSPVIFKGVLEGKTGYDLCLETLQGERYEKIK